MYRKITVIIFLIIFLMVPNIVKAERSSGVYNLTYLDNEYAIPYTITNGTLKEIDYGPADCCILIYIETTSNGSLEVSMPRELVDTIDTYGEFEEVDTQGHLKIGYADLEINCDYRKILFTFTTGSEVIYFGTNSLMNPDPYRHQKDKLDLNVDGKQFSILTTSEGAICDLDFIEEEKKISFIVKGVEGTSSPIDITIPQELLGGEFQVIVDGQNKEYQIIRTEANSKLSFSLDFPTNERKIEIVGTQAIPEFPNTGVIIFITMLSTILVSIFSKWIRLIQS